MALFKDKNSGIHDDMGGTARHMFPQELEPYIEVTMAEAEAILAIKNAPTPEQIAAKEKAAADAAAALAAKQDAFVSTIAGFTMAQVDTFVDNNFSAFTNPQKNFLKAVGKMAVLAARKL